MVTRKPLSFIALLLVVAAGCSHDSKKTRIVLAATTSLEDTGLLDVIAAQFARTHPGIELSPIAVGTGQAIELGKRGDADVLLSHDSAGETALVNSGRAISRASVMYNDFVVAGPFTDPAKARGTNAIAALTSISSRRNLFVSRADDSGTHRKEKKLWREAGIDADTIKGDWYIRAGVGMGDALLLAGQKRTYILTDRGTYMRFAKRIDLDVICQNDPRLLNKYGVTVMKGDRHKAAEEFARWITSADVQRLIGEFGRKEFGRSLFMPYANGAASHDTIPTGERR